MNLGAIDIKQIEQIELLRLSQAGKTEFEERRGDVKIICLGDSITGWNNISLIQDGNVPKTYPYFLQQRIGKETLVADCGIAGDVSNSAPSMARECLSLFPNSSYLIIGYGTNDLGEEGDLARISNNILGNFDNVVSMVREKGKKPIFFNVPPLNYSSFPESIVESAKANRAYHNGRLAEFCQSRNLPLVDLSTLLKETHFADGVHPNELGATIIADEIFKALKSMD